MGTTITDDLTGKAVEPQDASTIVLCVNVLLEPTGDRFEVHRQLTIDRKGVRDLRDHTGYKKIRALVADVAKKLDAAIGDFTVQLEKEKQNNGN